MRRARTHSPCGIRSLQRSADSRLRSSGSRSLSLSGNKHAQRQCDLHHLHLPRHTKDYHGDDNDRVKTPHVYAHSALY